MESVPIVDCHSHIFNAEDLPIDGFIKKLSPAPAILTGVVSVPLNHLTQWVAESSRSEADRLAAMLRSTGGLEAGPITAPVGEGIEVISDGELDDLFEAEWERRGILVAKPAGLEAGPGPDLDTRLAEGIESAPMHEQDELDRWLRDWGDPELEAALDGASGGGLEAAGFGDWYRRIKAARRAVQRYIDTLRLLTKDRLLIAADVAATYPEVDLFVPALVDFTHTASDRPSSPLPEQVTTYALLSKVSILGKIPDAPDVRIHSFIGFCPYREIAESELADWDPDAGDSNQYIPFGDSNAAADADRYHDGIVYDPDRARNLQRPVGSWAEARLSLEGVARSIDIVRHAIELGGFLGVKLYPPAGYLPLGNELGPGAAQGRRLDAALRSLYAYCERMQVPILAHAAHSNGFEDGYDDLAGPKGWELVLADYPELRLCFGHFGHLYGVGHSSANPSEEAWSRRFVNLIDQYPNVYADVGNSKLPVSESYRAQFLQLLQFLLGVGESATPEQQKRRARVMYGSDYWMNTMAPSHAEYLTVFSESYDDGFGQPARQQFMGANAMRWLGLTGTDDEPDPANLNRARLIEFYGDQELPDWLTD